MAIKSKTTANSNEAKGYKGHIAGSRKGKVHALFDKEGADAAWTLGLKLGLKEGTLRTWFRLWRPTKEASKTPRKAPAKTPAKEAATAAA